jgi:hypothetical protein
LGQAGFDQLKKICREAKGDGDYTTGVTAAQELVERRGQFEDYCWLAWFELRLGSYGAARLAILAALEQNPDHPAAAQFLKELEETAASEISNVASATTAVRPAFDKSQNRGLVAGAPMSPDPDSTNVELLSRRAATAADAGDWRAVMESAQRLVQLHAGFDCLCWLIRAQIQLDLYGRAQSNLRNARRVMSDDQKSLAMINRLTRELDDRVAARAKQDLYIVISSLPLTDETIWLVMERPAKEIARFKTEEAAKRFLSERVQEPARP